MSFRRRKISQPDGLRLHSGRVAVVTNSGSNDYPGKIPFVSGALIDWSGWYTDSNGRWRWAGTVIAPAIDCVAHHVPTQTVAQWFGYLAEFRVYVLPPNEAWFKAPPANGTAQNGSDSQPNVDAEIIRLNKYLWVKEAHAGSQFDEVDLTFHPHTARSVSPGSSIIMVIIYWNITNFGQAADTALDLWLSATYDGNFINR